MANEFLNMFEEPYRPMEDMTREELEEELGRWRNIWTWIEAPIQWWLTKIRSYVILVRRDYHRIEGRLGQIHVTLDSVDIDEVERIYDHAKGEATYETKTTTIKLSQLVDYSFLDGKEVIEETYDGLPREQDPNRELSMSETGG